MRRATCQKCSRDVFLVSVADAIVAVDPEIMSTVTGSSRFEVRQGRRVHAEMCSSYQEIARKQDLAAQMRAYTKRSRKRNHGL